MEPRKEKDYAIEVRGQEAIMKFHRTITDLQIASAISYYKSGINYNGTIVITTTPEMITNIGLMVECVITEITGELKSNNIV